MSPEKREKQDDESVVEVSWASKFGPSVPPRYRYLVREVAEALPEGWDGHAEWVVEADSDQHPRGYACTLAEEEAGETVIPYTVTIYPSRLERLSDSACRWVFAHEFAHIASRLRSGSIVIEGKPYTWLSGDEYMEAPSNSVHEDAADRIALEWGFDCALQDFLEEDK